MAPSAEPVRWHSLHIFYHGDVEATDRLLREALRPAVHEAVSDVPDALWFFIRYWEGGPHVRLRLRTSAERAAAAERRVAIWLADHAPENPPLDPGAYHRRFHRAPGAEPAWHPDHEIAHIEYVPEVDRYGGPDGMAVSEELFCASSRLALAAIVNAPGRGRRLSTVLDLTFTTVLAMGLTPFEAVRWLRRNAAAWRLVADGPEVDVGAMRLAAEREYLDRRDAYRRRLAGLRSVLGEGPSNSVPGHWHEQVGRTWEHLRELQRVGRLTATPDQVMWSHLHMLCNRLGAFVGDECYLSWLASLAVAAAHPASDYFADGEAAPDRVLHEASKFFPSVIDEQVRPGEYGFVDHVARWEGQPAVALPEPGSMSRPLDRVLLDRRSAYGVYGGRIAIEELSTLLGFGAGCAATVSYTPPSGETVTVEKRTYPSAGARYAIRTVVLPLRVDGVEPALYTYDALEHALRWCGPSPTIDALLRSSPMLHPPEWAPVLAADAPLWLFPVAHLTYQRQKYGLRAYRLVLLECGHLVQNLCLAATALGLSTNTLASFADDMVCEQLLIDGVNEAVCYLIPVGRTGL